MGAIVSISLAIFAGSIAASIIVLLVEIAAAVFLPAFDSEIRSRPGARGRVAVLVPAHNESTGLLPTLQDIKCQLRNDDRLLVVADNCSDDTAAVAAKAGAEVIERIDPTRIGKGYALDWGVRHLKKNKPHVVIMVDADCRLADGVIDRLAETCTSTDRPVQALYLMTAPENAPIASQVSEFAWRVKNWVRPLGLSRLNQPCQLVGTGMAFPWHVIRSADLASGWIVEDLKLGLDLAAAGYPPLFCPSARVTSAFASSAAGGHTQRKRWEHGHLATIARAAPRLMCLAVIRRDPGLLALALDLAIPPLSLLALLLILTFSVTGFAAAWGLSTMPLILSTAGLLGLTTAMLLAWTKYGRDVLPLNATLSIPGYVFSKLGLYRGILFGRMAPQWTRTDRTKG
jgi:cellulose synthase/poly-beta-1,6-N-acetylglucosamine synthase-like glycosyltransferase